MVRDRWVSEIQVAVDEFFIHVYDNHIPAVLEFTNRILVLDQLSNNTDNGRLQRRRPPF